MKKWLSILITAAALHTTPAIQQIQAQTSNDIQQTIDSLQDIPVSKLSAQQLQLSCLTEINKIRSSYNLPALQLDSNLSVVAQDYANKRKFSHTPEDLKSRLESEHYMYTYASENISDLSHALNASMKTAIKGQEESSLHKKNLLNEKAGYVGVGFCDGILVVTFSNK